jgi:hypothetical protein
MSTNNRISDLVNTQVPFFVRSDHRTFVAFLEAYYEYLEQSETTLNQGKVTERSQNLLNYIDVDNTLEDFSEKFYDTFLSILPKNITADKELILKNVQDFYRAKGTEKALKFLMQILSDGEDITVYYPKVDILRASDGKWYIQKSLRVRDIAIDGVANTSRAALDLFVSRLVRGATSNSTAVVERTDRFFESGLEVNELVISADKGSFENGESVSIRINDYGFTQNVTANIYGGINSILVTAPGSGYSVGNTVIIESSSGSGANAYISRVSSGNIASLSLADGGAGFIANGYILFSGGGGSNSNAQYVTVDTSGRYHPNTYTIFNSIINYEANTTLNTANYSNLNHTQVALPNANTYLINALSSFAYGPCGPITSVVLNSPGTNYTSIPIVDAIANSTVKSVGILGKMEVVSRGLGYIVGDRIEFWNVLGGSGYGANAEVSSVLGNGAINTVSFTANTGWITGGQGYSQSLLPLANVRTSTGTGANVMVRAIIGDGESFNIGTSTIGRVEEITLTSRGDGYTSAPTINLTQSGDGTAQAVATFISGVYEYPGRYRNDDGFLSSYNFLQNRDYYQNYSYVVKIRKALSEYKGYLQSITHPTGMKIFGEYTHENEHEALNSNETYITDSKIIYKTGPYLVANTSNASNIKISYTGHSITANSNVYVEFLSGDTANLTNAIYTAYVTSNNVFYISHANNAVSGNTGNLMFGRII